jgi:hypothetical protein
MYKKQLAMDCPYSLGLFYINPLFFTGGRLLGDSPSSLFDSIFGIGGC